MVGDMIAKLQVQTVNLYCTPSDLRELADRMVDKITNKKAGDSTLVEYIHGKRITIAIHVDQDRI